MIHNEEKEETFRKKKKRNIMKHLKIIFDNWNDSKFLEKHYGKADPRGKKKSIES